MIKFLFFSYWEPKTIDRSLVASSNSVLNVVEHTHQTYFNEFIGSAIKCYDSGYQFPALNFAFLNEGKQTAYNTYSTSLHLESAPTIIKAILDLVRKNAHHFTPEQLEEMGIKQQDN